MLTVAKVRVHGMRDERWTPQDKTTQIRGLIKLHERDQRHIQFDVADLRKRQYAEIRKLKREVREYRTLLETARLGDKQRLRNTLRAHRPTQIAFMEHSLEEAVAHMEQITFGLSKEANKINFMKKQRIRTLMGLKMEVAKLEEQQKLRLAQPLSALEQSLISQISNCVVKQNAATSVMCTYQNILPILKKDTVFFDAVLEALHRDWRTQGRCIIRATEMGQAATEDLARLHDETQRVEADVKQGMQERARAVQALKQSVDRNKGINKGLVRTESDADLRHLTNLPKEADSSAALLFDLNEMERIMQKLQSTTLVSTYLDILPRFRDQLRQTQRLIGQVQRREKRRDEALKQRNHAQLVATSLQHTMTDSNKSYKTEKEELMTKMEKRKELIAEVNRNIQEVGREIVLFGTALYTVMSVLSQVKPTHTAIKSLPRAYEFDAEEKFMDALYARKYGPTKAPEDNALAMLKNIYAKVGMLTRQLESGSGKEPDVPEYLIRTRALVPDVIVAKPTKDAMGEEIDALLLEADVGDHNVMTSADVKERGREVISQALHPGAVGPVSRLKRVRKEEKWI